VWSITTRTRVNNATAVTFSVKCFNPLELGPLSGNIFRKHNVAVAMKPYKTLKSVLVHLKDKQDKEDLTECVYTVQSSLCQL